MIKEQFSIVEEYNGLVENIYNHVKPLENDMVDILHQDGRDGSGYWSHTVGDISIRYITDLSIFYYSGYNNLPWAVRDYIADLVKGWREEIEEETHGMGEEEKKDYEDSFFSEDPHWFFAYIDIMIYDKTWLDSDEREKFKDFDNVLLIVTRLKNDYGHSLSDIAEEVQIGINKNSDMNKILEVVKKEIDAKVKIVSEHFGG